MKKFGKILLYILGGIVAVYLVLLLAARIMGKPAEQTAYYTDVPVPMLIAHQGGDGVVPGDTLYAFDYAASLGADVFEMDSHITKDGVIVLRHNETVDSTTDGTGNIEDMTLEELKKLDAGYKWTDDDGQTYPYRGKGIQVPALEELFQKYPDKRYIIEIKLTENPIDKPLCDLIREYNMQDKVLVASFHDDSMKQFRETCPGITTSASTSEVTWYVILGKLGLQGLLGQPQFQSLQVPWEPSESKGITVMTERFIKQAHDQNIAVEPWTVDDPELMKLYISWGTDGIITDRPDLMKEVLGR